MPPPKRPEESFAELIIENTRDRYSIPKETVERKIQGEWQAKEGYVKEKVERRREKGLEVLEKKESRKKRKEPLKIDKNELREALNIEAEEGEIPEERLVAKHNLGKDGE